MISSSTGAMALLMVMLVKIMAYSIYWPLPAPTGILADSRLPEARWIDAFCFTLSGHGIR